MNLKEVIAPSFYDVHRDIKLGKHTEYWLKGGRGSTKSSFVSVEIILGMMRDREANAVVIKKTKNSLRESVFEQLMWAIEKLGVKKYWDSSLSPLSLTYTLTGQRIIFRGAQNPKQVKSTKLNHGYFKYIWYEEVDEFESMNDIRTINQTFLRGGNDFCVLYTYNPPKSSTNWVNAEANIPKENRLIHHSDYKNVPKCWLGDVFFVEAEHLKKVNENAYKNEYLGEVTGTGGEIFGNVKLEVLHDDVIGRFDNIRHGIDWGYAVDPFCYIKCHYDATHRKVYIFDEIYKVGLSNRLAAEQVRVKNNLNQMIIADSAEPKSIDDMRGYGLKIKGAKKGAGSIEHGIKWLGDLEEIVIDPNRCINAAREFMNYELELDGAGNFKSNYPDKNNHSIDSARYALEDDMNSGNGKMLKIRRR